MSAATLIKEMRDTAGLTQAGLARRSGVSRTVINAYERGTRDPGSEALARLAEASGRSCHCVHAASSTSRATPACSPMFLT